MSRDAHRPLAALAIAAVVVISGAWIASPPIASPPTDGGERSSEGDRSIAHDSDSDRARIGPTASNEMVTFSVVLRVPGRAELDAFLVDLHDPSSVDYRRYLSVGDLGRRFGLPAPVIEEVVERLSDAGLEVIRRDMERTFLTVRGTAAAVNAYLDVHLQDYTDDMYGGFHVPDREPRISDELSDAVMGVAGLDTTPQLRPLFRAPLADVPIGGLKPTDVALAYDIAPLHAAGIDGTGQTVAIVSFDTFLDGDVAAYDAQVGLTGLPPVERRLVPVDYVPVRGSGTGEVNLDIDVVRSIAPMAQIVDYEGSNGQGFAPIMSAILEDGRTDLVSISWGRCEADKEALSRTLDDIQFDAAFAQGITVFVASGDVGAYGCNHSLFEGDLRVSPDYPSANPSLISVGGTFLWVRQDGTYLDEAAWEGSLSTVGTGGGRSANYPRPTWQLAPGVDTSVGAPRQIPDVAGPADPESGFLVVYTQLGETGPSLDVSGGTSAAAPFWAASTVLVRQVAEQQGVGPLGALGPLLYELAATPTTPAVFHDVTRGGNLLDAAAPGWDAATGLGSPDVTVLANAVVDRLRNR